MQPLVFGSPLQFSKQTNLFWTNNSQSDNPDRINHLKPDNSTRSLPRINGKFRSGDKDKPKHFNNIAILQNLLAKYFDPPTFGGLTVSKRYLASDQDEKYENQSQIYI